ncbi:hypothetical protein Fmac_014892 [Flemingia macrophylla]|uniref:CCR4-NOT transcription complex subunit 11 n=1 Tax=Flemingia macrophylla TaxID=520843 RepID=A0ABD1MD27_9FABA
MKNLQPETRCIQSALYQTKSFLAKFPTFYSTRHISIRVSFMKLSQPNAPPPASCNEGLEKVEKAFILQLLGVDSFNSGKEEFLLLDQLKQWFCDKVHLEPYHSLFKDGFVKNVLLDPDVPPNCDADSHDYGPIQFDFLPGARPKHGAGDKNEAILRLLSHLSLEGLSPHWIRPFPPRLPILDEERQADSELNDLIDEDVRRVGDTNSLLLAIFEAHPTSS